MAGPIVLDLPMPPSVNAIWRAKRGLDGKPRFYLDTRYARWKQACDGLVWVAGWEGGWGKKHKLPIRDDVSVSVTLNDRKRRGDADNRLKAVCDMLQRSRIIVNDKQVVSASIAWGEAPTGCRVTIEPARLAKRDAA